MVPRKGLIAAAGGVLAAFALFGCAPKGVNGYGAGGDPALANATGAPSAAASASPSAPAPVQHDLTNALVAKNIPRMGKSVTDDKGRVLYRFRKDTAKPPKSNCDGKCEQIWPPAYSDGNPKLTGINASLVGTVTRTDGTQQLTIKGWPVYYYAGDLKPGQWKGQNVGGTWFVVAPDGTENLTCLPTPPPTPVAPPSPTPTNASGSNTSGGDGY